jgi:transposase
LERDKSIAQAAKELGGLTTRFALGQRKQGNEFYQFRKHQATKARNHRITPPYNQKLEEELAILKKALGIFTRNQK